MTKKHRESSSSSICHHKKQFEHKIQLQLSDSLGFPVPGTEFWVTLTIIKEGPKVTIQVPVINFQTGPTSPDDPVPTSNSWWLSLYIGWIFTKEVST